MLLTKAIEHLGIKEGERISCLNGQQDVVPVYVKYGFTNCVWNVFVYGGKADASKVLSFSLDGVDVIRISKGNLDLLMSYDKNVQTVANRRQYFETYLENDSNVICVAVKNVEGNLVDFIVLW